MTQAQLAIATAVFDTLKNEIKALTWWEKLSFKDALDDGFTFERMTTEQRAKFLRVAMSVVKALSDSRK